MDKSRKASIRPSHLTKTQQAYKEAWKVCAVLKGLAMEGRGHEVFEEVMKQFKKAQQYNFNKLATEFATFLQYYYYNVEGNKQLGDKYTELAIHFDLLSHFENVVVIKSRKISHQLNQTRNPDHQLIEQLRNTCQEFQTYLKYDSATIWIYTYIFLNALATFEKKYSLVIQQSHEVISYLDEKGIDRTSNFYKDMASALINIGRYDDAVVAIEQTMQGIKKASSAWSVFVYYRVMVELHRQDYQRAYGLFMEAEKKRHIDKAMLETWLIVRGYMKFLIEAGKIEGSTRFMLGKFLNDIEVFSRDKSGQNVNVIILKIILRLQSDRGQIIDDHEAVKKYALRYMEKDSRTKLFFQMLHQIVLGDFQKENVQARAEKYLQLLTKQKGYNPDMEIIPYEDLWEMVIGFLD